MNWMKRSRDGIKGNYTQDYNRRMWLGYSNTPAGSHPGGVWESLIRIVCKVFYSPLREQPLCLDNESLCTLFCEVEAIINGCPITEISSDHKDLDALTPSHFLLMRTGESLPPGQFDKSDNNAN